MGVYVFSSDNITDIWAGIGAGLWAISEQTAKRADVKTKASKVPLGAYGLIYCSPLEALTTPFIVTGKPENRVEKEVWSGAWGLPFRIHPLGTPRKLLRKADFLKSLSIFQTQKSGNWAATLKTSGTFSFVPADLGQTDWQFIIQQLADTP